MPTPSKTSREELIGFARSIVEAGGADALTIGAVAAEAGVKGPSIYKHFDDREALLVAVEIDILYDLEATLRRETEGRAPSRRLRSMAHVYRRYGKAVPHRYAMIYRKVIVGGSDLAAACLFSAKPLLEELEKAGVTPKAVLPVSRTLVAFLHGFVTMELAEAFRLGGNIDAAFEDGLSTILKGI